MELLLTTFIVLTVQSQALPVPHLQPYSSIHIDWLISNSKWQLPIEPYLAKQSQCTSLVHWLPHYRTMYLLSILIPPMPSPCHYSQLMKIISISLTKWKWSERTWVPTAIYSYLQPASEETLPSVHRWLSMLLTQHTPPFAHSCHQIRHNTSSYPFFPLLRTFAVNIQHVL